MLQGLRFPFILLWLFTSAIVYSQSYSNTQYLVEDGLPSNEVFSVVQGQQGYIWASTDKGIVRYDGNTFKAYGIENGLRSTVIYKILASPLGGVAFYDTESRAGLIRNDSILYFPNDTTTSIGTIRSSDKGPVICYQDSSCYEVYSWRGKMRLRQCYPAGYYLIDDKNLGLIPIGKRISYSTNGFYIDAGGKLTPGNKILTELPRTSCFHQYGDKNILISFTLLGIVQLNSKVTTRSLSGAATSGSLIDSDGRLWVGLYDRGVEVISLEEKEADFRLLNGCSISSICEDDEGNMWLGTFRNGIIKLTKSFYKPIFKDDIHRMVLVDSQLVAASTHPSLHIHNLNSSVHQEVDTDFKISDLLTIKDRILVSASKKSDLVPPMANMEYLNVCFSKLANYRDQPISTCKNRLAITNIEELNTFYSLGTIGFGYTYVAQSYNDTIYLGRPRGLFRIYEKEGQFLGDKALPVSATTILKIENGFVIGTKGRGLIFTDRNFSIRRRYSTKNGLCGNFVSSVKRAGDMLICGTANGISFLTHISDPSQTQISSSYVTDGLWSSNITDLVVKDQDLFVATDKGIQKIALNNTSGSVANPRPVINHLNKGRVSPDNDHVEVAPGTKVIKVGLTTIFFHDSKNYLREYRLLGSDSNWVVSASSELEFLNLSPGKYELQFRTKLYENNEYSSTYLKFELLPLFTQTIWFKIGIGLLILLILLLLRYFREHQIKEKNGMILLQEQLRYKALASQLNPHFMFNALGSVQNLIITKKNDKAAEYLASFSGLLSKTLRNTNELFIPLRDEMVFINEYVEIEKFRFEKSITFTWHISKELEVGETLVPTMFLQPYVENAIIHGINPSAEAGQIDISIRVIRTDVLEIQIRDNGIGIEVAKASRSKRARKSMAMENIQTRIQTMAKLYKNTFRHQAIQLVNDEDTISGTEVILDIPYKSR